MVDQSRPSTCCGFPAPSSAQIQIQSPSLSRAFDQAHATSYTYTARSRQANKETWVLLLHTPRYSWALCVFFHLGLD
ncbi:hypothetical protein L3X38_019618 [Prunus dulcis]|uniref:Uncharacterized protein n=1 Tax=Prunus dulcis TaxID=3755 RepID=A0AAD4ZC78_PRUDU|nr:hypothetical protein L3X38_019618 [Prunus dulcis]